VSRSEVTGTRKEFSKKDFKKRKRGYRKEKVLRKKEKKLEKEGEIKARSRKQKRWRTR
jgi:hypothetical protein